MSEQPSDTPGLPDGPEMRKRMTHLLRQIADEGSCRGCGAIIHWVKHQNGKKVPYTPQGLNHFIDCPNREDFRG